jgi:hypothetical protein
VLSHEAPLQDFDPVLYGDYEIPWVPHYLTPERELGGSDITFEDFFQFIEQNPSMYSTSAYTA